jgi:hypothetical protein
MRQNFIPPDKDGMPLVVFDVDGTPLSADSTAPEDGRRSGVLYAADARVSYEPRRSICTDTRKHESRNIAIDLRLRAVGLGDDDGQATVGPFAD